MRELFEIVKQMLSSYAAGEIDSERLSHGVDAYARICEATPCCVMADVTFFADDDDYEEDEDEDLEPSGDDESIEPSDDASEGPSVIPHNVDIEPDTDSAGTTFEVGLGSLEISGEDEAVSSDDSSADSEPEFSGEDVDDGEF